jgi:hypothetical protein
MTHFDAAIVTPLDAAIVTPRFERGRSAIAQSAIDVDRDLLRPGHPTFARR